MTTSRAIVATDHHLSNEDDMFSELEPISAFEIKKDYLATQLAALMAFSGKSRSQMAEELEWKRSRVTRVLSGNENLTIRTICDFSSHLGFDFDVIFHAPNQTRPRQPWQIENAGDANVPMVSLPILNLPLQAQSARDVAVDLLTGNGKEYYYSFNTEGFEVSSQALAFDVSSQALPATTKTNLIPFEFTLSDTHNLRG